MRRFPSSWDRTISALGFRRNVKRIKRDHYRRKNSRIEPLEIRAMLTTDTIHIEAEDFDVNVQSLISEHTWVVQSDIPAASGASFVTTYQDNDISGSSDYSNDNSRLDYSINIDTPGTYYVWVRGYATNGKNDSVHIGLDGQAPVTCPHE